MAFSFKHFKNIEKMIDRVQHNKQTISVSLLSQIPILLSSYFYLTTYNSNECMHTNLWLLLLDGELDWSQETPSSVSTLRLVLSIVFSLKDLHSFEVSAQKKFAKENEEII